MIAFNKNSEVVLSPFLQKAKMPPKPTQSSIYNLGLPPGASAMSPLRDLSYIIPPKPVRQSLSTFSTFQLSDF